MDEDIKKLEKCMKGKVDLYQALHEKDDYVIRLLHWIETIEELKEEVMSTDMDKELESSLHEIALRLIREVGFRVSRILP